MYHYISLAILRCQAVFFSLQHLQMHPVSPYRNQFFPDPTSDTDYVNRWMRPRGFTATRQYGERYRSAILTSSWEIAQDSYRGSTNQPSLINGRGENKTTKAIRQSFRTK